MGDGEQINVVPAVDQRLGGPLDARVKLVTGVGDHRNPHVIPPRRNSIPGQMALA